MKRSFAYLVLALMLSLLLCGCADTMDHGNVTASPWPDVTAPAMPTPTPTAAISASPLPEIGTGNEPAVTEGGADTGVNGNGATGLATSTPIPTDANR